MTQSKRGTDIVTPPASATVPSGHRNDYRPVLVNYTYRRVLWITSEKVIEPGHVEFQWVITDRDGHIKDQFTGERSKLPPRYRRFFG
jgi:hypothetical protein